ncbi:MAG: helix-turn-helix transcriptional regulator [Planctomycetes bacterium]|nr:helix-turn-helix transcriptional regulator [Planctomycetota bacterium]MBI3844505.1 helix-turn-helix transcriptional regulator [Planctomycetota bacterium]
MGNLARRLAKRLIELRGETPQYLFARKLGISKSTLNRLEIAQQNVSLRTIERICQRLKIDITDLFSRE